MKGAVYLKNKEGLVAYIRNGVPEWIGGSVVRADIDITVTTAFGSHMYRLLDHIMVCIFLLHFTRWIYTGLLKTFFKLLNNLN